MMRQHHRSSRQCQQQVQQLQQQMRDQQAHSRFLELLVSERVAAPEQRYSQGPPVPPWQEQDAQAETYGLPLTPIGHHSHAAARPSWVSSQAPAAHEQPGTTGSQQAPVQQPQPQVDSMAALMQLWQQRCAQPAQQQGSISRVQQGAPSGSAALGAAALGNEPAARVPLSYQPNPRLSLFEPRQQSSFEEPQSSLAYSRPACSGGGEQLSLPLQQQQQFGHSSSAGGDARAPSQQQQQAELLRIKTQSTASQYALHTVPTYYRTTPVADWEHQVAIWLQEIAGLSALTEEAKARILCGRLDKSFRDTTARGEQRLEEPSSVASVLQALRDLQPDPQGMEQALSAVNSGRYKTPLECLEALDRVYRTHRLSFPKGDAVRGILWVFGPVWEDELKRRLKARADSSGVSLGYGVLHTCATELTTHLAARQDWESQQQSPVPEAAAGQARQPNRRPGQQQQQRRPDDGPQQHQRDRRQVQFDLIIIIMLQGPLQTQ
jgi:hypothetical protein